MTQQSAADWPDQIFEVLQKHRIRQVAYVPDAGHRRLIERCRADAAMLALPLTTEEEGVALLAGAWLGGDRGVLLMQSSGVGNCINMFSLTTVCRLPLLLLVTMRGQHGETNPWQVPMGQNSNELLRTAGFETFTTGDAARLAATVDEAAGYTYANSAAAAVLISQDIIGVKTFGNDETIESQ